MTIAERQQRKIVRKRVIELLQQGLTTEQIHQRTGETKRQILRIRASLKKQDA